jgi:hypothetical protein
MFFLYNKYIYVVIMVFKGVLGLKKTLKVLNDLKKKGIIKDYAIAGGIATIFYVEPILTYDLDIFFTNCRNSSPIYPRI